MLNEIAILDSHFHVIDDRFPLVPNNGYLPDTFTCEDYLQQMEPYNLCGGVVVSGSFQAFDQSYLLDALDRLGPAFVGVTQVPIDVADSQLLALHSAGVRAVRFNLKRGGSEDVKQLSFMAHRVYDLAGWHVELYVDSTALPDLYDTLIRLPAVSIDHLGLSKAGLPVLTKLAEKGVRIKASGFGRVDFEVGTALEDLYLANPNALMFGSDLPSTRAPRPFVYEDTLVVAEALDIAGAARVFSENAIEFYGLKTTDDHALVR